MAARSFAPFGSLLRPHSHEDRRKIHSAKLEIAEPVPFENTTAGRRGPLLKLAGRSVAAEGVFQFFDFRRSEALRPEQFAGLGARIGPTERGHARRGFELRGDAVRVLWPL